MVVQGCTGSGNDTIARAWEGGAESVCCAESRRKRHRTREGRCLNCAKTAGISALCCAPAHVSLAPSSLLRLHARTLRANLNSTRAFHFLLCFAPRHLHGSSRAGDGFGGLADLSKGPLTCQYFAQQAAYSYRLQWTALR